MTGVRTVSGSKTAGSKTVGSKKAGSKTARAVAKDLRIAKALQSLAEVTREKLARHPLGHLAHTSRGDLELPIHLPLGHGDVDPAAADQLEEAIDRELEALLTHRAVFRPGHVYCLRCASAECEHSELPDSRQIFVGYGPTGLPRFLDFAQWLLEVKHAGLDDLYRRPPRLVLAILPSELLESEILDAYKDRRGAFRIHGQVVAGWFQVPNAKGVQTPIALTFQVVSSRRRHGKRRGLRRLGLNVLARDPDGQPLDHLYDRLRTVPWTPVVRWGQQALESVEKSQAQDTKNTSRSGKAKKRRKFEERIEGILRGIARRLEHDRRSRDRRTEHGQQRHTEGDRPTRMALGDLARARDESVLLDVRRKTFIVLGGRGRAHVWNNGGKLVTSIRYAPESIERKKAQGIWRSASPQEITHLRKSVGAWTPEASGG